MTTPHVPPEWAFEFHAHECPFMPIGYRMGKLALEHLGAGKEADHGLFVFPEIGEGHPQACMMDGMQIATGATYGKGLMAKTFYGKLAATFFHPAKGAVRLSLLPEFVDAMGKFEFFGQRRRGVEPSQIPLAIRREVIQWVHEQPDATMFKVEPRPGFAFAPVRGSFDKTKCSGCGEYVFDRYLRMKGGNPVCIPCSGYEKTVAVER